jgi:hypothetical protein
VTAWEHHCCWHLNYELAKASNKLLLCSQCHRKTKTTSRRRGGISEHINSLGTSKNRVIGPDETRNQDCMYWRRPAGNYALLY